MFFLQARFQSLFSWPALLSTIPIPVGQQLPKSILQPILEEQKQVAESNRKPAVVLEFLSDVNGTETYTAVPFDPTEPEPTEHQVICTTKGSQLPGTIKVPTTTYIRVLPGTSKATLKHVATVKTSPKTSAREYFSCSKLPTNQPTDTSSTTVPPVVTTVADSQPGTSSEFQMPGTSTEMVSLPANEETETSANLNPNLETLEKYEDFNVVKQEMDDDFNGIMEGIEEDDEDIPEEEAIERLVQKIIEQYQKEKR